MTQMTEQEQLQRLSTVSAWLLPHLRLIENLAQVQRGTDLAAWMRDQGHLVLVTEKNVTHAFGRTGKRVEIEAAHTETLLELHPDQVVKEGARAPESISATADQITSWAEMVYTELSEEDREQTLLLAQVLRESLEHLR